MPSLEEDDSQDAATAEVLKCVKQDDGFMLAARSIVVDERRRMASDRNSMTDKIRALEESNERLSDLIIRFEKAQWESANKIRRLERALALSQAKSSDALSPTSSAPLPSIPEFPTDKLAQPSSTAPTDGAMEVPLASSNSNTLNLGPRSGSVDVSEVDPRLEGIPIKRAAIRTVFGPDLTKPLPLSMPSKPENQVSSSGTNNLDSESPKTLASPSNALPRSKNGLHLSLSPPNPNLIRNAGHTPLAVPGRDLSLTMSSSNADTPKNTNPTSNTADQQTESQLNLTSESTDERPPFAPHNTQTQGLGEDPALQGPLSMPAQPSQDDPFIASLDVALKRVQSNQELAQQVEGNDATSPLSGEGSPLGKQHEVDPPLRFKRSLNFGSAFGSSKLPN
ncbi:MAG: hypothetical protein M1814_001952 [Vezdaea aestivalis]|nr:MAG: hypothetical protein M1814_001952 [Vezdaea aestivalis]